MSIQYTENGFGTSILNRIMVVLVTTASSVANPFGFHLGNLIIDKQLKYKSTCFTISSLIGAQSTGGEWMLQKELSNYLKIYNFAQKFLSELENTPPEFDEVFLENFWDTLA